jgi:hypothetical protein
MRFLAMALGIAVAAAAFGQGGQALLLHPVMKDVVAPQAQVLWDVGNRGMDDNGNADASKISAKDWTSLGAAAQKMKDAADALAAAPQIAVVGPGMKLQDEGGPGASTPQQIQGFIDADRKGFAEHAKALSGVADEFVQAARGKDAAKLMSASGRMDEVCEGCHLKFWYPNQS